MTALSANVDDSALLRQYAARGDAAAFAELVRRYADLVYATARRVTGSSVAAEDVAQDCFLALATHSPAVRGSIAAWLHRASLNRSLEVLRSERARKAREAAAAAAQDSPSGSESADLIAHVDEAIAALPDDLRIAVTEHFLCGRGQAELAAALGVSQPTISRRIESALQRLRRHLGERGVTGSAMAALPMLLGQAVRADAAPSSVRAALTKIGLSGVRDSGATAVGAAAGGTAALIKLAAALLLLIASAGAVVALALWLSPPQRPTRQVIVAPNATTSMARHADDDDQDDDDDEDEEEDEDEDAEEDRKLQPR